MLNTFGTSLQKENDMFLVVHNDGKQLIAPDKVSSISISKGARISSDAALLALEHEIDLLFVDNTGKPVGRLWSVKYGSVSTIRRNQLNFLTSKAAVDWIREVIAGKLDNQVALLLSVHTYDTVLQKSLNESIRKVERYAARIRSTGGDSVREIAATLRGWEGAAGKIYFGEISKVLPEKFRFGQRSQHPAMDMFNCLLNYAYGILYGKVEGALIRAGIDPYAGIYHRDEYNRPVLVYDVIENFRVWADYVVFGLCRHEAVNEDCFSTRPDGSFWLEANGRRILIQAVNDYLGEVITLKGSERSRGTHIQQYAHALAQQFLKFQ